MSPPSGVAGADGQGDYFTIVKPSAAPGAYWSYQYTRAGSPPALQAPTEPGECEVRYQSDRVRVIFGQRPIRVKRLTNYEADVTSRPGPYPQRLCSFALC